MKVLLISPPETCIIATSMPVSFSRIRGIYPPLGLLSVASYVKRHSSHAVTVLDCVAEGIGYGALQRRIAQLKPDVVGVQVLTPMLIDALKVARLVKNCRPDTKVIFGGPHPTVFPGETLGHQDVDYIVCEDGERSFLTLLERIHEPRRIGAIGGVGYKSDGKIVLPSANEAIEDLDSLEIPNRTLLPYWRYRYILAKESPVTTMVTSRGCSYDCSFCARISRRYRTTSPQKALDEIKHCLSLGIREIIVHDDIFTIDHKRVFELCALILRRNLKFRWSARTRVDKVTYEVLAAMKDAGCALVHFGVESAVPEVLSLLRKGITPLQTEQAFACA